MARFLYFYRQFFFIAYEVLRLRRAPTRRDLRFWVLLAGGIWLFIKLPQEYWIHVAQLDFTDAVAARPVLGAAAAVTLLALLALAWTVVRPRLPEPDWTWRVAADPLPPQVQSWRDRAAWLAAHGRVLSKATAEKVVLVGLISVVYAQLLPGIRASDLQLFVGLGVFVVLNAAVGMSLARGVRGTDSMLLAFVLRLAMNVGLVLLADALLGRAGGSLNVAAALFFVGMLSLLTLLDDRFRPAAEARGVAALPSGEPQREAGNLRAH